jgi:alginate O-acetyltransferase complex protein AlgI
MYAINIGVQCLFGWGCLAVHAPFSMRGRHFTRREGGKRLFLFLPSAAVGFFLIGLRSPPFAALWLGCASLVFYSWWHTPDLAVLVGSTAFKFVVGRWLATTRASPTRRGLGRRSHSESRASGVLQIPNFLLGSVASVLGWTTPQMAVVLPLGISFFTFTQIAFLVDTYRGKVRETNPIHYLLFVTYFPHLIAGPVMHHAR